MHAITKRDAIFHPELDYMMVSTYGSGKHAGEPRIVTDLELAEKERARLEHAASLEGATQALDQPAAEAAQKAAGEPGGPVADKKPPAGDQP